MSVTLHYFDVPIRGELARLAFRCGGCAGFEDHQFTPEEWPSLKHLTITGKAPWLTINGRNVYESTGIAHFAARCGPRDLIPRDPLMAARCWQIVESLECFFDHTTKAYSPLLSPQERSQAIEDIVNYHWPSELDMLNRLLATMPRLSDHAVGNTLTLADCAVAVVVKNVQNSSAIFGEHNVRIHSYPNVKRVWDAIQPYLN